MMGRISRMATLALATCLATAVGIAGAADEAKDTAKDAAKKEEKKASISDSPYDKGPPPTTGGFTDTWQGGKKTSGDIPSGMMEGAGGAKPDGAKESDGSDG